jgi:hypothetical protein
VHGRLGVLLPAHPRSPKMGYALSSSRGRCQQWRPTRPCADRAELPSVPISCVATRERLRQVLEPQVDAVGDVPWNESCFDCAASSLNRHGFHNTFAYYSPMGGERGSTTRQRMSGKICCMGSNSLPPDPNHHGERLCAKCTEAHQPLRDVYTYYMLRDGWYCQFL